MNCKGLVIGERIVGENGKFLDVLTDSLGLVEVAQKGVKSLKSSNRSALQMFAYSSLDIDANKDGKHYSVKSSELIEGFYGLREDVCGLALATYMGQVVRYTVDQHTTESPTVLRLVLNILHYISTHKRSNQQLKSIFELRLLSEIGFTPNLLVCGRCELSLTDNVYFSIPSNSTVCEKCSTPNDWLLPIATFKAMQHIVFSEYGRLFNFKLSDGSLKVLNDVTERLLLYNLNRGFTSLNYYKNITGYR
jgi:DNA repair protein RecO (recombination protein O)